MKQRPSTPVLAAIAAGLALLAGLGATWALTPPPDHVVPGCLWWTARSVDDVATGDRGCIRGYFLSGGGLAVGAGDTTNALHMDFPPGRSCRYRPGDPMVVRGEVVFGDGRTVILVFDCR